MIRTLPAPTSIHFWGQPVLVQGEYFATCACGFVSDPALSPRGALFFPCVFEQADRKATANRIAFNRASGR